MESAQQNKDSLPLQIAGIVKESIVDGNGIRFVIFTQGCPHNCRGCHNPESHDPAGGYQTTTAELLTEIMKNPLLSGVTFSGGEPFLQPKPLIALAKEIKKRDLNLYIYTGYLFENLVKHEDPDVRELLACADYLVDGPFIEAERDLEIKFRGSRNQRIIDVPESLGTGQTVCTEV